MNQLEISPEVRNDLAAIKDYIARELNNPQAARDLVSKITKKIRRLLDYPGMGESIREGMKTPVEKCREELDW